MQPTKYPFVAISSRNTCGLVFEQRTRNQITGEPMKFLTLADDRYCGNRIVRQDLQELRTGHRTLSRNGSHRDGGTV